ncbi:MAG: hypothetical protein ABIP97_01880 [Chthoniobacterales bacterium]
MSPIILPCGYPRIKMVASFHELVTTPLEGEINALCWERTLPGDFRELVERLGIGEGIVPVDDSHLCDLSLSDAGKVARDILLEDQQSLRALDLAPSLDCIHNSPRNLGDGIFPTDVFSFHVDSATVQADTYLCSYTEAPSEGLRNDEAQQRVDIPETRAALLKLFGGEDDEAFLEYLNDHYYDLHYVPVAGARPFSFGLGNLWRIATEYPGSPVPPCIHRAPSTFPGQPPRLLLIS